MFRVKFVQLFLVCALDELLYGQAAFDFQTTAIFTSSSFCENPNWGSTKSTAGYKEEVNVNACMNDSGNNKSYKVSCSADGLQYTLVRYDAVDCTGNVGKTFSDKTVNTCIDVYDDFAPGVMFLKVNCYESDPYAVDQANAADDDVVAGGVYSLTTFSTSDCSDGASPITATNGDCTTYNAAYSITPSADSAWKAFKGYVSTDGTAVSFKIYGDTACKSDSHIIQGVPGACIESGDAGYKITAGSTKEVEKAACFAGTEAVFLESGGVVQMKDVQLGDRIQVASVSDQSLSFAEVISLPHGKNSQSASFIEIETASGATLKVTPYHLVVSGACGTNDMKLNLAQSVVVGDCMDTIDGPVMVTSATEARGRGIYTVVTSHLDGVIVVNGFKTSSFAVSHAIANSYYHIHRALHAYMPGFDSVRSTIASAASQVASIY